MKRIYFIILFLIFANIFFTKAQDTTLYLPEIDVVGDRIFNLQTINGLRPQYFPNIQSDIGTMLKSMPNTSGIRRGGSSIDPVYRGFRNNQLLITTNSGIQIEGGCPNRMDPTTSHFDADEIKLLRWETGSNMLLYGQAIGGVLVMNIIEPQPFQKWKINFKLKSGYESNFNGISNSIFIKGGNKKIFFTLAAGYKNYGNYTDGRDSVIVSSFQKDYLSTKFGIALKPNQHILIGYSRNESRDVRFPALPMDENCDFTDNFNLSYVFYNTDNKENFRVNAYQVRVNHLMDNFNRPQANRIVPPSTGIMRGESAVAAITTGFNIKKNVSFNKFYGLIGGDFHQINKDGTRTRQMIMTMGGLPTTSTMYDNLWKDAVIRNAGIYAQLTYPIQSIHSLITATLRFDEHQHFSADTFNLAKNEVEYFSNKTRNNHLLSYGLRYDVNPSNAVQLSLDFTTSQRSPSMNELYIKRMLVGFDNYDYLGNPNLMPEVNHQISINTRIQGRFGIIGINLFASQVENYIGGILLPSSIITLATQGSLGVKQFSNLGTARFYGGEFVANSSPKNNLELGLSSGYTYAILLKATKYNMINNQIVSFTIIENDPLPEIPAMTSSVWAIYKITSLNLTPRLSFDYTMPQHSVSIANNELSTPDYLLVNASISYSYKKRATLNLGVNNLFNQAYFNHLNRKVISSNPIEKIKLYEPGRVFFVNLKFEF